jgi:tight adherence protein B
MELVAAIALFTAAVAIVFVLVALRQRAIAFDRRRPYDGGPASPLSRFAGGAVGVVGRQVSRGRIRLFNEVTLENAGYKGTQADVLILVFAGGMAAAVLGLIVGGPPLAIGLFIAAPVAGHLILSRQAGKRRSKFDEQLTDTLQLLAGSLRAGHSILRAIDAAATEAASPTAEEMRRVVTETSLGRDILASLNDTAARMKNEDFVWVAQAIQINQEVGGNLADVLDQVNETIRERSEIKGQISALAAEGKFSAYILMAMPVGIVVMLMMINPGYMGRLFSDPLGWAMMGISVVLMTIGGLWLRKIIDLKF